MPCFTCASCGGVHSIDSCEAERHCLELMKKLEAGRSIELDIPPEDADPSLSTEPLFGEARGQMFGMLICAPQEAGKDRVILRAFSGQYAGRWEVPGWVPPVIDSGAFEAAVSKADPPIKKLGALIESLPPGTERQSLTEKRRQLSQSHMREIHRMYAIRNFHGETAELFDLFRGRSGIPAGTGDCCAPKLLNYASSHGLRPLSLAEFFWGRENRSGTKKHGVFYQPCEDKCVPILGYMLCGARNED